MNREFLRPDRCYSVEQIQDLIGVSGVEILQAIRRGDIARSLGEGMQAMVLGIDVMDWLDGRPHVWPGSTSAGEGPSPAV